MSHEFFNCQQIGCNEPAEWCCGTWCFCDEHQTDLFGTSNRNGHKSITDWVYDRPTRIREILLEMGY